MSESVSVRDAARTRLFLLGASIVISVLVRVAFSGKSLWLDEGVSVANAWANGMPLSMWHDWLREMWKGEFNMVFYFALLRVWMRAGQSEVFLRLLSVIPAVATVPVVYALGKRLTSARAGMVAALLMSVHAAHVLYSQEVRGYTLVVFLCAAATWFFVAGVEEERGRDWALYWICMSLGVYTHFFAGLVLAAHWASLLWLPRREVPWKKVIGATIGVIVAVIPALVFVATSKGGQVDWVPKPSFGQFVNVISEFAGSPSALPVYLLLWVVAMQRCARPWWREQSGQSWKTAVVLCWVIVPLLLAIAVSAIRPMLVPRYLLICAPGAVVLAAMGAGRLSIRSGRIAVAAAIVLSMVFVGIRYRRPKEDWRGASAYVLQHASARDAVVVAPWWSEPVYAYYRSRWSGSAPKEIAASAIDEVGRERSQYPKVWVIQYARPQGLSDPQTSQLEQALSKGYSVVERHDSNMLQVRLYVARESNGASLERP